MKRPTNYYFQLKDIPEFVLDNLDTLGFKSETAQIRRIVSHAAKRGIKPNYTVIQNTIEGYTLPTPKSYNPIALYYHWQLWED